mgnify:CR=1 FL=1
MRIQTNRGPTRMLMGFERVLRRDTADLAGRLAFP